MTCFKPSRYLVGLAVSAIVLSLPGCKTTKSSNKEEPPQQVPQTQAMPYSMVNAVPYSALRIDTFTVTQPIIDGNQIVQGEITTSQAFDYVTYEER
jgi:hypothetical protein